MLARTCARRVYERARDALLGAAALHRSAAVRRPTSSARAPALEDSDRTGSRRLRSAARVARRLAPPTACSRWRRHAPVPPLPCRPHADAASRACRAGTRHRSGCSARSGPVAAGRSPAVPPTTAILPREPARRGRDSRSADAATADDARPRIDTAARRPQPARLRRTVIARRRRWPWSSPPSPWRPGSCATRRRPSSPRRAVAAGAGDRPSSENGKFDERVGGSRRPRLAGAGAPATRPAQRSRRAARRLL